MKKNEDKGSVGNEKTLPRKARITNCVDFV